MARLPVLLAAVLVASGLLVEAAAPPRPTCWSVVFDRAASTLNLEIVLPKAITPTVTGYTARATFNGRTVAPTPLFFSIGGSATGPAARVNVSFPISAFANEPNGRYSFTAAAINADGVGEECANAIPYTVTRPAAPGLLGATATCDTIRVEFTRPEGAILIEDYVLTVGGRTKVSPFRNTAVGGKKLLHFPAWPFTAGSQSLVLAAKSMFGVGAASRAVTYTHVPCDPKVIQLEKQVTQLEQALKGAETLATSATRDNTTCSARLQTTESKLTTAESELTAAKSQLDTTKSQLDTTKSQLDTAKSDLAAAVAASTACADELSQCRASLKACQDSNRTLADAAAALTAQLSQCKSNLTSTDTQLAECIRQREACTTAKAGLETSLETCNKDKAAAAAQCDSDRNSLQTSLDSCNTRRAACNTAKAAYEYECNPANVESLLVSGYAFQCTTLGKAAREGTEAAVALNACMTKLGELPQCVAQKCPLDKSQSSDYQFGYQASQTCGGTAYLECINTNTNTNDRISVESCIQNECTDSSSDYQTGVSCVTSYISGCKTNSPNSVVPCVMAACTASTNTDYILGKTCASLTYDGYEQGNLCPKA